jgi:hypothetical protein
LYASAIEGSDEIKSMIASRPPVRQTRAISSSCCCGSAKWVHREAAEREVERVVGERQGGDVGADQRDPLDVAIAKPPPGDVEQLRREIGADDTTDPVRDRLALVRGAACRLQHEHRRIEWLQVSNDPRGEVRVGEERVVALERRGLPAELGADSAVVLGRHRADSGSCGPAA